MAAIEALPEKPVDLRPLGPADLCYIQFSSGSTRHPHGVQITQARLDGQSRRHDRAGRPRRRRRRPRRELAAALSRHGPDRLPDGAALGQLSIDYLTPRDFARRPMQWLNLISRNRGTIAYSPSFGYDLATRRGASQVPADLDLSCWRHAGIGGDMIRPDVLDRFAETFEPQRASTARPSSRATAWPRSASPSPSARMARACAPTWSIAPRSPTASAP